MAEPLSDVLRSLRIVGGVFLEARFTAPWCVAAQLTAEDCRTYLGTTVQVIAYHYVVEGRCLLGLDGRPDDEVEEGEIVLLPRNDRHILASAAGVAPVRADTLILPAAEGGLMRIRHGGGGAATRVVCGFLGSEDLYNPLIASLPPVLTLPVGDGAARAWIEASLRFAASGLADGRPASAGVQSRLAELLLVEAVRQYVAGRGDEDLGWLRGLNDPHVGRALATIHRDIRAPWSTAGLAREVALSRSAFAERFTRLVGLPPIRYLTVWRLQTARLQLRETGRSVAQIAWAVGYESEEAFSRAFKREFGLSPTLWRDQPTEAQSPA